MSMVMSIEYGDGGGFGGDHDYDYDHDGHQARWVARSIHDICHLFSTTTFWL